MNNEILPPVTGMRSRIMAGCFAAFVVVLVFLPALRNGFVDLDDPEYVYENQNIQKINAGSIRWMATAYHAANWHPLTWFSHAVDYAIWGPNPFGHHLANVLLHGLNAALVVLIVRRLVLAARGGDGTRLDETRAIAIAVVTAVLFGVHPLRVESVAWVAERKDVLYAFFFLWSILAYLGYAESGRGRTGIWRYLAPLGLFILALLSKPMAVTLPLVFLVLDMYPLRRLSFREGIRRPALIVFEKIPFFVIGLCASLVSVAAQRAWGTVASMQSHHPFLNQALIAMRAPVFYLGKMVFPAGLSPNYPYPLRMDPLSPAFLAPAVLFALLTLVSLLAWSRFRAVTAAWLYYIVTLLPVSGIVQFGGMLAADRYTYLPSLGPVLLAVLALESFVHARSRQGPTHVSARNAAVGALIVATIFLSALSIRQTNVWKDSISLWSAVIERFPDFDMAYASRSNAYARAGKQSEALYDGLRFLSLRVEHARQYRVRGEQFLASGETERAIRDFNRAVELDPKEPLHYYLRGVAHGRAGNYQKAVSDLTGVLHIDSSYAPAYYNRAVVYQYMGDSKMALKDYAEAARRGHRLAQEHLRAERVSW